MKSEFCPLCLFSDTRSSGFKDQLTFGVRFMTNWYPVFQHATGPVHDIEPIWRVHNNVCQGTNPMRLHAKNKHIVIKKTRINFQNIIM